MIFLDNLFEEFCSYFDGKLKWSGKEFSAKNWTSAIFEFFDNLNKKELTPFIIKKEFMTIDYIWRYDTPKFSTNDIELALEHENESERIDLLLEQEVQHLIDIKARNKVGIFYISQGDEKDFIDKIKTRIRLQSMRHDLENYLIILGYTTTQDKKKAILFRGFFLDKCGEQKDKKERIIFQVQ